jgi:hypothetical protein
VQLGGSAYLFAGAEAPNEAGPLTRIGCVGPFELLTADQADVIYLRTGAGSEQVYRFEVAPVFQIEFQVVGQPQVITSGDQTARLRAVWHPSIYSSPSVVLFVADPDEPAPDVVYGLDVSQTVVGDAIGEYRLAGGDAAVTPAEVVAAAEEVGINPDLTLGDDVYVLVDVHTPIGTTRNGFMTLFGSSTGATDTVLGRDRRQLELLVFIPGSAPSVDQDVASTTAAPSSGDEPVTPTSTELRP